MVQTRRSRGYTAEQIDRALAMYDERLQDGTPRWLYADIIAETGITRGSLVHHVKRTGRAGRYRSQARPSTREDHLTEQLAETTRQLDQAYETIRRLMSSEQRMDASEMEQALWKMAKRVNYPPDQLVQLLEEIRRGERGGGDGREVTPGTAPR